MKNSKYIIFLLLLMGVLYYLYNFHIIMYLRPQSVHQWRQCDSAAYSYNYYLGQNSFFFPEAMTLLGEGGRVISEFPILYYITGKLYSLFGFQEWIARIVTFVIFIVGVLALFRLCLDTFDRKYWAFLPVLFLLSSPMLCYYALNFLPNVPALSFTFISWYYFFKYVKKRHLNDFITLSFFATLAALLKPVEIFNYLIILLFLTFEYFGKFGLQKLHYTKAQSYKLGLIASLVMGINIAWILYAKWYAKEYGYEGNLLGILPIWGLSGREIIDYLAVIKQKWLYQIYHPFFFYIILIINVLNLFFWKKLDAKIRFIWLSSIIALSLYVLLFFQTFYHHDYYWINAYVWVAFSIIAFIHLIQKLESKRYKPLLLCGLSLIIVFEIKHSRHIINERYFGGLREQLNENLLTISPYLRSIGIQATDKIISVPDLSPNISLYLIGNKGWTECYTREWKNINHFVPQGAKYLIVNKEITREPQWYLPYMNKQIGEYKGIKIFALY